MQKRAEIPSKPRFSLATKKAYELLAELEICEFPVDPRKIIRHFPSWHLKGWLELQVNTGETDPLNLNSEKAEAKTVKLRGSDDYLIVYDERVDNIQRIRWTLAHEIGHIVMGHLIQFDATALNRRGLTQEEHGVLEVEAHCFASDLLAPKTIIRRFDFQNDPQGIALICDISRDAAERRLIEIKRMDFGYYPTENRILRNFYNHLSNGGFYQAVHDTSCRFYLQ
jgi:Zn-dependent peptidase ImmA (M78 family)